MLSNHITPASATNLPPCELLFNRMLDTYFSKLRPADLKNDFSNTVSLFAEDQSVWALVYSANREKWTKGTIVKRLGYKTYLVAMEDGKRQKKHIKQLRRREPDDVECDPWTASRDILFEEYAEDESVNYLPLVENEPNTSSDFNDEIRSPAGPYRLVIPEESRSPTPSEDLEDDNIDSDEHTATDKTPDPLRSSRPRKQRSFFQIMWD